MDAAERKNREDTIYDILRTDILELKLRPGMVFSIKDIMEVYDVGRTPVRDALISLSKDGLVTLLPQKGTHAPRLITIKSAMSALCGSVWKSRLCWNLWESVI